MPKGVYIRTKPSSKKGRTLEEIYGIEKSKEIRENLRKSHLGQIVWNKGKKDIYSKETRILMGLKNRGIHRSPSTQFKKGDKPWNTGRTDCVKPWLGKKRPEITGEKSPSKRPEVREKLRKIKLKEIENGTFNYGFKKGKENINYIDGRSFNPNKGMGHPTGKIHWKWRGGEITGVSRHWNSSKWKRIRKMIMQRDDNTCQECGDVGCQVHHIIPYRFSKDDSEDNLVTICKPCHVEIENKIIMEGMFL